MGNDVHLWEIAKICGKWLKYLRSFFKYVLDDIYILEMAQVFEKRLNYVGNDFDVWEMVQICGKMT